MARALRSSGASGTASTPTPPATNGTATRTRALKRKRTGDDDHSPKPAPKRDETDSASPLTELAPSPAVKDEADDLEPPNGGGHVPNGSDNAATGDADAASTPAAPLPRSPTPGAFVDGCDQPPSVDDAHKLLTVLEMFDTQSLLARHVPPAEISLRVMLKNSTHSIRSLKAAVTALAPTQAHPRARLSLEQTAQRSFCDLALGLLEEISQKQPASKDRTSIFQLSTEHKPKSEDDTKPIRYSLQQTIYGTDYYTSVSSDSLTPEKAATLATGQASLTAIIPATSIPVSAMPNLGKYIRKPAPLQSLWYNQQGHTTTGITELSYGSRCSFAPTYDSSGSTVTRSEVDALVTQRMKAFKAFGPPPPLPPTLSTDRDAEMTDDTASQETKVEIIHPDLVSVPAIDPSLESESALPLAPPSVPKIASSLDPTLDSELCSVLDTAFQELALEDSIRGLLQSNARAMTRLVDIQNERFQRWNLRKPDLKVLDVGEGEELQLAQCIEKTLGLLTSLRPRTILSSIPSEPTSLIPPASTLRALHRTLPYEPSPGYRGTLDPRREMSLSDNTTIKMANVPAPVPAPPNVGTPRQAVPPQLAAAPARPAYPTSTTAGSPYYSHQPGYPQTPAGQYPQAQAQPQGVYPQGQYPGYQQQQAQQQPQGQYPAQYPMAAAQAQPPAGQTQYPYPYNYPAAQPGAYPQAGYTPAQPGTGSYPAPTPGQNPTYSTQPQGGGYPSPAQPTAYPTAGQTPTYPTPGQAATYPTSGQATTYPTSTMAYTTPAAANYPAPTPGATGTPRVITNMIKPAAQGVWSPGQGYTPTPTSAAPGGYNAGYNPAVSSVQPQYPGTPGTAAPYSPSPTGTYAPTPVKPTAPLRGAIPPHVRSTPGTPASPSTYLPGTGGYTPLPAVGAAPYTPWNGQGVPSTPRAN
ncbi:unnamed protein product [Rhizoctonia solani]|uniref:Uncharacterized protein n=1 Tax=Rhizoctonia solani TaxID=456999 RepID=A0A8H2XFI7_9AGAM|nr:unnamed protein product [Rhizoctonia solani]